MGKRSWTAINCVGTRMSMCLTTSTGWSTISGTGTSRICTMGAKSASCSTVCCCTRSCGLGGSPRQGGRDPPGSPSCRLKSSGWGRGSSGTSPCASTRTSSLALAVFGRCTLCCLDSARAIATAIRSCRRNERKRRSLPRRAPVPPPAYHNDWPLAPKKLATHAWAGGHLGQNGAWWWWWSRRCHNSPVQGPKKISSSRQCSCKLVDERQLRSLRSFHRRQNDFSTSCNCGITTVIHTSCTCRTRTNWHTRTSTTTSTRNWGISMI